MKKSIVVSTPKAKFSALAYKANFQDSIRKVAELGFDGVELAIKDPKRVEVEEIKELVRQYNLEVPAIGTGQAWSEERLSFSAPQATVREKAIRRIKDHIDFAARFSAQVIIGLIRGRIEDDVSRADAEKWSLDCVRECAEVAEGLKVGLTLEPLNRYETNFINTVAEGIEFIKKVDFANMGMLIDTFHMNIEEVSIYESIVKAKDYVTHVHLADSNRWAPGSGHLDFTQVVKTLEKINYRGYLSAEILPLPDPDTSARLTIEHLNQIGC